MARYVILSEIRFTERDWQRFGCAEFAAAGYEIMPVEVGRALGQGAGAGARGRFRTMEGVIVTATLDELERLLAQLKKNDVVLLEARLSKVTRPLFRLLKRHRVAYAAVDLGLLPLTRLRSKRAALSLAEYLELRWEDIRGALHRVRRLLSEMTADGFDYFRLQPPWLWLTAGTAALACASRLPRAWTARRVAVSSFDQMTANTLRDRPVESRGTAVFLDEAFPDHPDFEILGLRSPVTAERYWPSIERLFRAVEAKTGLRVVVAPHPKTSGTVPDPIRVRMAEVGRTAELVRESALVLSHVSTAVSFAVLFRRPLLFVTTDEIERSSYRGAVARMSSWFGLRRVNADRFEPAELVPQPVSEALYRAYEHAFLRSPDAADRSPWEILRAEAEGRAA
ncbi:MAG TPA: hypothetical protein VHA77_15120 [Xanthobacteraceae bacterium]|nr:hypothetical protein [Xanthobacteraceae bacterium]